MNNSSGALVSIHAELLGREAVISGGHPSGEPLVWEPPMPEIYVVAIGPTIQKIDDSDLLGISGPQRRTLDDSPCHLTSLLFLLATSDAKWKSSNGRRQSWNTCSHGSRNVPG